MGHFKDVVVAYATTLALRLRSSLMWCYCRDYLDRIPQGPRDFTLFFVLQGAQFVIVVVNGRAFNHLQYTVTAVTDTLFCMLSWTIWKRMKDAEGWWSRAGYVMGGTAGSLLGMYITRMWGD